MFEELIAKEKKVGVIGLGYVGLPIALELAKKMSVVGFDINEDRVELMKNGIDPSQELESKDFEGADITFTANLEDLRKVNFFIVAVPTPVDDHNVPNLVPVISASRTVGEVLKKGDYVVFESTVYPGCTEEDCIPVLEAVSGLVFNKDFKVGYSPERINPGDTVHTLTSVVKVVSGSCAESLEEIAKVYESVVTAGVHRATCIKVAEAAKIIENTQRDLNIALMNELSRIFDKMGINTFDVLEAAGTKWNFLKFFPGLVGGHCIGVDPYYLTYKSEALGYKAEVILSGRRVNDNMPLYVAKKIIQKIIQTGEPLLNAKVLVMGATFKENVSDIRNSKVFDLVKELQSFSVHVDLIDPHASADEVRQEYDVKLTPEASNNYMAIVVAVNHKEYTSMTENDFVTLSNPKGQLVDIKGIYRNEISQLDYWSL